MNDEIEGRMLVIEIMAMTSLGIVMASAGNDPDMSKARAVLDFIRSNIDGAARERLTTDASRDAAARYADDILSQALENLALLRGGGR